MHAVDLAAVRGYLLQEELVVTDLRRNQSLFISNLLSLQGKTLLLQIDDGITLDQMGDHLKRQHQQQHRADVGGTDRPHYWMIH